MNKSIFLAIFAGTLLMGSCSSDEKVDAPRNPAEITFRASTNKLARAEVNTGNLESIYVWGYNKDKTQGSTYQGALVFNGTNVTKSGADWTYSPLVYWINNSDYTFSALNTGTLSFPAPLTGHGSTSFENTDGTTDLVWATQVKTTPVQITAQAQPGTVDFSFRHALCRVKFRFSWVDPNHAYSIKIKDLGLEGTPKNGDFALGKTHENDNNGDPILGAWSNERGSFKAPYDFGDPNNRQSGFVGYDPNDVGVSVDSEYRYLIPGDFTGDSNKLSAYFTVTLYQTLNGTTTPSVITSTIPLRGRFPPTLCKATAT